MPVRLSRERETKRRMRKGEKPAPPPPPKPTTHRKKAKRSNIAAVSRKEAGVRNQPKQNRKKNDTEIHFFWLTPAVDRSFVRSFASETQPCCTVNSTRPRPQKAAIRPTNRRVQGAPPACKPHVRRAASEQ